MYVYVYICMYIHVYIYLLTLSCFVCVRWPSLGLFLHADVVAMASPGKHETSHAAVVR